MYGPVLAIGVLVLVSLAACDGRRDEEPGALPWPEEDALHFRDTACPDGTCQGDVVVQGQAVIDDIAACRSIDGTLVFEEQDWLTSIEMHCLTTVSDFQIRRNAFLSAFELPSLFSVGDFAIEGNHVLKVLTGMPGLTYVGEFSIKDNPSLDTIEGLVGLRYI